MSYPNEAKVAVVSIPPKYARKIANRIHWIYDTKELATFGSVKQLKSAKFWSDIDS
jgi:predicted nucleotidyltransferase